jgi:glyoxylase-like metal-dependent hydrolase (beta-lactamase superfamily II)/rhodanese-related sulfurtransferase
MAFHVEELNRTNCRTYLLSSGSNAVLIDPVRERIESYRKVLSDGGLRLKMIIETHLHADHLMFNREIKELLDVPVIMHEKSPSPLVDRHVEDSEVIEIGKERIVVMYTPGHTPDSICLLVDGAVFTGDTLLIGGSGRTDFPGGDPGAQFDAIKQKLFRLPGDTIVWPAHDYKDQTNSTIGKEMEDNPRLAGKSRAQYVDIMNSLNLPFPKRIQEALQVNQSGFESDEIEFPTVSEVAAAKAISPSELAVMLAYAEPPLVLDVREPEEFVGDLGHVEGSLLVPLDSLAARLPKLAGYSDQTVVVVCRSGARSATASAILKEAGFADVLNLDGGMLAWINKGLRVQH